MLRPYELRYKPEQACDRDGCAADGCLHCAARCCTIQTAYAKHSANPGRSSYGYANG
jgi:hypothetical protein